MTTKNIVLPVGTEVRASEIGYYEFWYPSKISHFLSEEIHAEMAPPNGARLSTTGEWMPVVVSVSTAKNYGSPIRVLWVREKNNNS